MIWVLDIECHGYIGSFSCRQLCGCPIKEKGNNFEKHILLWNPLCITWMIWNIFLFWIAPTLATNWDLLFFWHDVSSIRSCIINYIHSYVRVILLIHTQFSLIVVETMAYMHNFTLFFNEDMISYTCPKISAVAVDLDVVYGKSLAQFSLPVSNSVHLKLPTDMSLNYRISNKSPD